MPRALPLLKRCGLAAGAVLALALVPAQTSSGNTPAACTTASLHPSLRIVNGSAGAGQITYRVRLRNVGHAPCTVSGRPVLRLLDHNHAPLPTHLVADHPGTGTAALITVPRGESAYATARFSPDIPGPSEPTHGACEPTAHYIRVTLADGTITGGVFPPTAVCSHGRIVLGLLHRETN
ncbi:MAG: hypothetical protein JWM73_1107 [Solirubrobacterales bacterium]|nr:hypothetical protein [Solirubrobacterales bacterium]